MQRTSVQFISYVQTETEKAFSYYLKSAEAGNAMGIRKTFICYYYGIGVEKDEDE
ncbi:11904_t:CDS:1, partial [Gigaspora rosea]